MKIKNLSEQGRIVRPQNIWDKIEAELREYFPIWIETHSPKYVP
jgi:hypothetical protein